MMEMMASLFVHLTVPSPCLQQSWGMIHVDKAFEYLKATKDSTSEDINLSGGH
jgi:hypothetical protein